MSKILKYKLIHIIEDNKFIVIFLSYIIIFNYSIIINSGILTIGAGTYNTSIKMALMMNNFSNVAITFGMILAIYLGTNIIGKDIETKQMYVLLTNIHSRVLYILLSWVSVVLYLALIQSVMSLNVMIISKFINVPISFNELLSVNCDILLNMTVIATITSLFSVMLEGYLGSIVGLLGLIIFNIHTYATIPLANIDLVLSDNIRRILVNIVPIKDIKILSSIDSGYAINFMAPAPLLIENMIIYQILFTGVLILLTIYVFKVKDL